MNIFACAPLKPPGHHLLISSQKTLNEISGDRSTLIDFRIVMFSLSIGITRYVTSWLRVCQASYRHHKIVRCKILVGEIARRLLTCYWTSTQKDQSAPNHPNLPV